VNKPNRFFQHCPILGPACFYPLLLTILLIAFYGFYLAPRCYQFNYLTWDALRDIITAQHLLAGGSPFADPVYKGYYFWYPPLHAVWLAGWAALFDWDIFRVYSLSPIVLNWLGFPAVYCLARRLTGCCHSAFIATLSLTAIPWFVTYVMAQPTVMAHALGPALLLFLWNLRLQSLDNRREFLLFSLCAGGMGLIHPPTFLIVFSVILLNLIFNLKQNEHRDEQIGRLVTFILLSLAAASPYWLPNVLHPIQNSEPMRYIAPGLYRWEMVLPGTSWWRTIPFLALVVVGLWKRIREHRSPETVFLWALLAVTAAGQFPAYLLKALQLIAPQVYTRVEAIIPVLVPHEFQLYFQIALCLLIAAGFQSVYKYRKRKLKFITELTILYFVVSLGCSFWELGSTSASDPGRSQVFLWKYRLEGEWKGVVKAIREKTGVNEVICSPDDRTSFFVVSVRTGRKSLLTYASHSNLRANLEDRQTTRKAILSATTKADLLQKAEQYEIRYLLCHLKTVPKDRIRLFQSWFPVIYDDGVIFLFSLDDKMC